MDHLGYRLENGDSHRDSGDSGDVRDSGDFDAGSARCGCASDPSGLRPTAATAALGLFSLLAPFSLLALSRRRR
ncbi:MAG: hypothetical protein EXR69_01635 [Myxococcales bacterium]|nr:hypothetical protein [Myxococcales bacterium]